MYTDLLAKSSDREKEARIENDSLRRLFADIYAAVADLLQRQSKKYTDTFPKSPVSSKICSIRSKEVASISYIDDSHSFLLPRKLSICFDCRLMLGAQKLSKKLTNCLLVCKKNGTGKFQSGKFTVKKICKKKSMQFGDWNKATMSLLRL